MWPPGKEPFFVPRDIILTYLVEVHKMMLHTKYQDSMPCGFKQEDM